MRSRALFTGTQELAVKANWGGQLSTCCALQKVPADLG
jgi:hypothetical protein